MTTTAGSTPTVWDNTQRRRCAKAVNPSPTRVAMTIPKEGNPHFCATTMTMAEASAGVA